MDLAVLDMDEHFSVRLRFVGIPWDAPAGEYRVIYEHYWAGLDEIGERSLSAAGNSGGWHERR